ncbi:MAG TPA: HipA domain-containing protein [Methylibium sp.]|uniref:type II toxin-antitoxin system HipA family toxin n=1 Tax=Methylibium sp. TaxID=2067992 RepID=UPI002DBD0BB5|nr:HipA domain-containing protein [Methylibium sp.]HEU4460822.1 HipA domain-containing protein [Methylibium sp.]
MGTRASQPAIGELLHLWWLADPQSPRWVGTLRLKRRGAGQPPGVSLEYAEAWLADGLALSEDLPLQRGEFLPTEADAAAGAVDDARPDRWGERVIRLLDRPPRLSTLDFLYFAGDERFGALGVSLSASEYLPRRHGPTPQLADLAAMHELVHKLEAGEPVAEPLRRLVMPGTSLGGARPKALITIDGDQRLVKFAEAGDLIDTPLVEHATMTLAAQAGIQASMSWAIPLGPAGTGHAMAIRRFDRGPGAGEARRRRHALSAHVALRAAGQEYGYPELALLLRRRAHADDIQKLGAELFRRMLFNILIDNTDDHEKNHVLLVDERQHYRLSPIFDVLPAGQALGYQQMRVGRNGADATLENAISEHRAFGLTEERARANAASVAEVVAGWKDHFAAAGVTPRDIDELTLQIDRDFLADQRREAQAGGNR